VGSPVDRTFPRVAAAMAEASSSAPAGGLVGLVASVGPIASVGDPIASVGDAVTVTVSAGVAESELQAASKRTVSGTTAMAVADACMLSSDPVSAVS
jgi:hypothetical protein